MPTTPATMKAAITQADKTIAVRDIPVPSIDTDEVLIKTTALAQNPTDWKHLKFVTKVGTIAGVDYAGVIAKIGSAVTTLAVGNRVAGIVHGGHYEDRGAFAEYVKTPADLTWKIPEGTISDEQAATLGCGAWTAVQILYHPERLGLIPPPSRTERKEWIFIYGGSTSVGLYAIQLAHASGYQVATVASPKNHRLVRMYGADAVFDYRDPSAAAKIRRLTHGSIHYGVDTISDTESVIFSIQTFGPGRGILGTLLAVDAAATSMRKDIKVIQTWLYTVFGRPFGNTMFNFPAFPQDREHMASFLKLFPDLVKSGSLRPNPTKLWSGGLTKLNDGFDYMISGKISAEKIVYRL